MTHKHTNVLVLSVPQRHDLIPNSSVNNEAKILNKTLVKLKKVFPNHSVINVNTDRNLYTRHGLQPNAHGKEHVANKITAVISDLFSQKVSPVIALKWKKKKT